VRPPTPAGLPDILLSPFAATDISLKLTALYNYAMDRGSFLRCLLHVDARHLSIERESDGSYIARIEAGVQAVEASGRLGERAAGPYEIRLPSQAAEVALERGLLVSLDLPLKPGPYQVRAAIRDPASGRAGSAAQFISVPDIAKGRLALSGIFLGGTDESDFQATPAVRRFRRGTAIAYAFGVYNARLRGKDQSPSLAASLNLYRDGERVDTVTIRTDATLPSREGVIALGGTVSLLPDMPVGSYMVEAVVTDLLRSLHESSATQAIDFQVLDPQS
jgi:hypothetical protein